MKSLNEEIQIKKEAPGKNPTATHMIMTNGVLEAAKLASCFWFVMGQVSLYAPLMKSHEQEWELIRTGKEFVIFVKKGTEPPTLVFRGVLGFPFDYFKVLVRGDLILLPEELSLVLTEKNS